MLEYSKDLFEKRLSLEMSVAKIAPKRVGFRPAEDTPKLLRIRDDQAFVHEAYRIILGREPDDVGLLGYLEALRKHTPRRDIIKRMAASEEAQAWSNLDPDEEAGSIQKPPIIDRLREGLTGRARQVVNQLLVSRFDSLDFKLGFLSNTLNERDQSLSKKLDSLAERLDGLARPGLALKVPAEEPRLSAYLEFQASQEPGLAQCFASLVKAGMVVVDIGAHVGRFTLLAARSAARVHAFEPTPHVSAILQENARAFPNVQVHTAAVTGHEGRASLTVYQDRSLKNTLSDSSGLEVRATTLDAALAHEPRIDLINIDAPGAESLALAGMTRIIAANPSLQILMSFRPARLARPADLLQQINSAGFQIRRVDEVSGTLHETTEVALLSCWTSQLLLQQGPRR